MAAEQFEQFIVDVMDRHRTCFLEEFKEADEIKRIISSINTICSDQILVERNVERFQCKF